MDKHIIKDYKPDGKWHCLKCGATYSYDSRYVAPQDGKSYQEYCSKCAPEPPMFKQKDHPS